MSRRLSRISLALFLLLSSEIWALGLGEINLESALNEPLRAKIELLSATPEELDDLTIGLASVETFDRYGLDRPGFLQDIQFQVIPSGRADGNIIELRSTSAMAEPFLTFLVEASWARGRLLREYTVLLDPPTFAPPAATQSPPVVTAPSRTPPADSGRIERPVAAPAPAPAPQRTEPIQAPTTSPTPEPEYTEPDYTEPDYAESEPDYTEPDYTEPDYTEPDYTEPDYTEPEPVVDESPYDTLSSDDVYVERGDTLWGITLRVRPDSRLTINQTMLAIFEANPEAFGGNINILSAGASLRIPSADEVYQIGRADALEEVKRHHAAWGPSTVADDATTRPSLTLVPPDDEYIDDGYGDEGDFDDSAFDESTFDDEPLTREQEIEQRIADLEAAEIPQQEALLMIRDNELAMLRQELAEIRGEYYELPVDETATDEVMDEDPFVDDLVSDDTGLDDDLMTDDTDAATDVEPDVDEAADTTPDVAPVSSQSRSEPSLVDRATDVLTNTWTIIIVVALVIVGGLLFWFMRRGSGDDEESESWQALDSDAASDDLAGTQSMRAPTMDDDSFVVVEQESAILPEVDDTVDAPAAEFEAEQTVAQPRALQDDEATGEFGALESAEPTGEFDALETKEPTGEFGSIEDTFSSETAVNLDQSDPIAEADFHMAYGLYDQAADLINGALAVEPTDQSLLTKLCEIYFVWGNRDAFIDAADRLNDAASGGGADWDKIVIMGQQIASDHALFAGAAVAGATKAVDLSFEAGMEDTGALDMDLDAGTAIGQEIVDLGADSDDTAALEAGGAIDFDVTAQLPAADETAELLPPDSDDDSPTIEDQFDLAAESGELPSIESTIDEAIDISEQGAESTGEIDLDDLGLDLGALEATEVAPLDVEEETEIASLDAEKETEIATLDDADETEVASLDDLDATGETPVLEDTGVNEELVDTGVNEAIEDTSINEAISPVDVDSLIEATVVDEALLDATGATQVLPDDFAVETASNADAGLGDDDKTLLAGLDDDADEDYDFAQTEALPADVFTGDANLDATGEMPAIASTDVDLDLDDLTAALQVSEMGDTIEQLREDVTMEQPRPAIPADEGEEEAISTMALDPSELSDDLHDARTMTEVGTKLDLARAYVDMGDPAGARSILEEVLNEGDEGQRQQAQQLLDSLPS